MHDVLLAALAAGRDPAAASSRPWLAGAIRRRAAFVGRGAARRRRRDADWQALQPSSGAGDEKLPLAALPTGLPPALKAVAALAFTGHSRPEIAHLLGLGDPALRQRLSALKRRLAVHDIDWPETTPGLTLPLDYGRLRDALAVTLRREGGLFASHDPDGHLFVVRRSQVPLPRQHRGG